MELEDSRGESFMFRRRWLCFGKLESDEGFSLAYGNRSITYTDERGSFKFGLEDGYLFPIYEQTSGERVTLGQEELSVIMNRILRGVRFEGHEVSIYSR